MTQLLICSLLVISLHVSLVEPFLVRRQFHDGVIYEDYAPESDNLRYTITGGAGWDDLSKLVEANDLSGKAMFCSRGPGPWLLYPDAMFGFGTSRQLKLLYGEYCAPLDNVNSIQPLGGLYTNIADISAVIAFSETYFRSLGKVITSGSEAQSAKSAVFLGNSKWTVDDGSGKQICIAVLGQNGEICMVEDVATAFSTASGEVTIKKGCESNEMESYALQSCYTMGFRSITYEIDFSLPSMKQLCSSSSYDGNDQTKEKFLRVMKLWHYRKTQPQVRLGQDLEVPPEKKIMSAIPTANEKYRLLTHMASIVYQSCPSVSPTYLELLVEVYFTMHAKNGEIWNVTGAGNGTAPDINSTRWAAAEDFMRQCVDLFDRETAPPAFHLTCKPADVSKMTQAKQVETVEDFLNGESYDFVIEQIWLMLNFVTPYCTTGLGYHDNYWSEFPLLLKKDLLYPLKEQWKNPGRWTTYYPLMFSGFDLEQERRNMIKCVQVMILNTPAYDPLSRPPGFLRASSSKVKEILGNGTSRNQSTSQNQRRKRQRLSDSDTEEVTNEGLPAPIMPKHISPTTPQTTTTTTTTTSKPKVIGKAVPRTVSVSTTTTTTTTEASTTPPSPSPTSEVTRSESGKKKKKSKRPRKDKKGGKTGKKRHSKQKNKEEPLQLKTVELKEQQ